MQTGEDLEKQLEQLKLDYKARRSILEMLDKSTKREDLAKMRREQLEPIEREIQRLKEELVKCS